MELIGKTLNGENLYVGDICSFKVSKEFDCIGVIVYSEEHYGYTFLTNEHIFEEVPIHTVIGSVEKLCNKYSIVSDYPEFGEMFLNREKHLRMIK